MGLEDIIFTSNGALLILVFFAPGFVTMSCLRHWFGKLMRLDQIEIVFWSIPSSMLISNITYSLIYKTGGAGRLEELGGAALVAAIFIFMCLLVGKVFVEEKGALRGMYFYLYVKHVGFRKYFITLIKGQGKKKCPRCKKSVSRLTPYEIYRGDRRRYDRRVGASTEIVAEEFMCRDCRNLKRLADRREKG
jgi:hypothetical protein